MRKLLFTLLLTHLSLTFTLLAQTNDHILTGSIIDEQQKPIQGAVITALSKGDNRITRIVASDDFGKFSSIIDWSKEWLQFSAIGYQTLEYKEGENKDILITLTPLSVELNEVMVNAKSIVSAQNDRLVFHISNKNITQGNNMLELLRFTPLMRVDDSQLSMLGKDNVRLYINGKKSNMSTEAIAGYLKSLPAGRIDRIELITDPGSEYRVDPNDGIVNLILRKDENQGLKGELSLNDNQVHYNSYDGSLYLDYQKNKIALSSNIYGGKDREFIKNNTLYNYTQEKTSNDITEITKPDKKSVGGTLNADYQLSDKQIIGAIIDVYYSKNDKDIISTTSYNNEDKHVLDSTIYSMNNGDASRLLLSANLNYRLRTDSKGSNLSIDADYLRSSKSDHSLMDYSYTENGVNANPYKQFTQLSDDEYSTYSGKVEYSHVFNPLNKLRVGIESYRMNATSDFHHADYLGKAYVTDPGKTNQFDYDETFVAAYLTYNRVWSKQFVSTIGLRGEYMSDTGIQTINQEEISARKFNPLPTMALMYKINPDHQLAYTLSMRIARIPFRALNPFRYYISPTVYEENNPELQSPVLLVNSLKYTFKRHYTLMLNYLYTNNGINIFRTPAENGQTRISRANCGEMNVVNLVLNWNDSFLDNRLYINTSLTGNYNQTKGAAEGNLIDVSHFSFSGSLDAGFLLSKRHDWSLTGSYLYQGATQLAQENRNYNSRLNIETKKNFKNGISLKLGISNLLYNNNIIDKKYDNYSYYQYSDYERRCLYLGVSIPFGRKKVSGAESRSGSSSDIQNRIKSE